MEAACCDRSVCGLTRVGRRGVEGHWIGADRCGNWLSQAQTCGVSAENAQSGGLYAETLYGNAVLSATQGVAAEGGIAAVIINLLPLRGLSHAGLVKLPTELKAWVFQYDAALLIGGARRGTYRFEAQRRRAARQREGAPSAFAVIWRRGVK